MQYSVVNYKTVKENSDFRIDGEYFHPEYLELEKELKSYSCNAISDFAYVTDGEHGAVELKEDGIKYLMAENVKDGYIDISGIRYVDESVHVRNKRAAVKEGDILISIKGSLGQIAVAEKWLLPANLSRDVAIIKIKNPSLFSEYVALYLQSQVGQKMSVRLGSGGVQQMITLGRLRETLVPILSISFQKKIKEIYIGSQTLRLKSKSLYSQVEGLVLEELGLDEWKPEHGLAFVKNFSEAKRAERIDAEYFQPKYEEIVSAIKKYKGGFDELGNLVKIKKSVEPGREAYQERGVPFVRVSNLSKFELSDNNQQYISEELYSELNTHQPKKDEILLSKDATPGMAYHLNEEPQKMIVSGGILRLKIESKAVLPEYLTLVLNSVIVQKQIERDAGGSIINHWRPDQVKATLIPILKEDKQKEIKELVEQSFNNRKLSKSLLEIAKRGVEIAIEKDEVQAEAWIRSELKKIQSM